MNPVAAHSAANDQHPGTAPDLDFAHGFEPVPLRKQLQRARSDYYKWRATYELQTMRGHGHNAIHPDAYTAELHRLKSLVHSLTQLQQLTHRETPTS